MNATGNSSNGKKVNDIAIDVTNERKDLMLTNRPTDWLKLEFDRIQRKNPRYSLRAFAKTLDIHSGRLSEYLSGKRHLTLKAGKKISNQLKFDKILESQFLKIIENDCEQKRIAKNQGSKAKTDRINTLSFYIDQDQLPLALDFVRNFRSQLEQNFSLAKRISTTYKLRLRLAPAKKKVLPKIRAT